MPITLLTHWALFALFAVMWLLIAGSNIAELVKARARGGGTSLTLFLGGVVGAAAMIACPLEGAWMGFWVPALIDPGSLPALFKLLRARKSAAANPTTPPAP